MSENFWDTIRNEEATINETAETRSRREHIDELVVVPQTQRGPLKWRKEDDELFGEVPEPLSVEDSKSRVEFVHEQCRAIFTQNKRANTWFLKNLLGLRLLDFDRLSEDDRKIILDQRHGAVDDLAYRKERTERHLTQLQAMQTMRTHRANLEAYLKIANSAELSEEELAEVSNLYSWLLYQLQFDSLKWIVMPRAFNRAKIFCEIMVKLYVDAYFASTFLTAEQINRWFSTNQTAWRLLLEKQVIFVLVRSPMALTFWDLLFEELQKLLGAGKSIVFISHDDAAKHVPKELQKEYRGLCTAQNATFLKNANIDRMTYRFTYNSTPTTQRTDAQANGSNSTK